MEGLTDKQPARPNKTLKHYLLEISYLVFFLVSAQNFSAKLFLFVMFFFCFFFLGGGGGGGGVCAKFNVKRDHLAGYFF